MAENKEAAERDDLELWRIGKTGFPKNDGERYIPDNSWYNTDDRLNRNTSVQRFWKEVVKDKSSNEEYCRLT